MSGEAAAPAAGCRASRPVSAYTAGWPGDWTARCGLPLDGHDTHEARAAGRHSGGLYDEVSLHPPLRWRESHVPMEPLDPGAVRRNRGSA